MTMPRTPELSAEQIEHLRDCLRIDGEGSAPVDAVCDQALSALSLQSRLSVAEQRVVDIDGQLFNALNRASDAERKLAAAEQSLRERDEMVKGLRNELAFRRQMHKHAMDRLVRVSSFMQADNIVLPDGRTFEFHPPDDLVWYAWRGLTDAIRDARIFSVDAALTAPNEQAS